MIEKRSLEEKNLETGGAWKGDFEQDRTEDFSLEDKIGGRKVADRKVSVEGNIIWKGEENRETFGVKSESWTDF